MCYNVCEVWSSHELSLCIFAYAVMVYKEINAFVFRLPTMWIITMEIITKQGERELQLLMAHGKTKWVIPYSKGKRGLKLSRICLCIM